ncbi:MAG TPA: VOC family protein [Anaerolineae bacterium]|nr:VOC family protein [Anaerolineae bacterium]
MTIEHIAIWTDRLEVMIAFYARHFGGSAGARYQNPRTGLESCFVTFATGARLELMQRPSIGPHLDPGEERQGYAHLAFCVGSRALVDELTRRLEETGCTVISAPRETGDGYYESCILDPDGNRVELTE